MLGGEPMIPPTNGVGPPEEYAHGDVQALS